VRLVDLFVSCDVVLRLPALQSLQLIDLCIS